MKVSNNDLGWFWSRRCTIPWEIQQFNVLVTCSSGGLRNINERFCFDVYQKMKVSNNDLEWFWEAHGSARRNVPGRWKPILTLLTYILDTPCSLLSQGVADLNAARIPPGQTWVWWVLSTRDMFRCLLQRQFLTKCCCFGTCQNTDWGPSHVSGALLRSLGWPWDPGGVLGGHWEIPWRPWRSFGAILEVSEGSGVDPVKVELMKQRWYLGCFQ